MSKMWNDQTGPTLTLRSDWREACSKDEKNIQTDEIYSQENGFQFGDLPPHNIKSKKIIVI